MQRSLRPVAFRRAPRLLANTQNQPLRPSEQLHLDRPSDAYKSLSTAAIFRAWFVFRICSINIIVQHAQSLLKLTSSILGDKFTYDAIVKRTFFDQFCAGEDESELHKRAKNLARSNIGPILDYAAEEDLPESAEDPDVVVEAGAVVEDPSTGLPSVVPATTAAANSEMASRRSDAASDSDTGRRTVTPDLPTLRERSNSPSEEPHQAASVAASTDAAADANNNNATKEGVDAGENPPPADLDSFRESLREEADAAPRSKKDRNVDTDRLQSKLDALEGADPRALAAEVSATTIEDDSHVSARRLDSSIPARSSPYSGEHACDFAKDVVLTAVQHSANLRNSGIGPAFGMAAVKASGLCKPSALEALSNLLMAVQKLWCVYFSDGRVPTPVPKLQEFRRLSSWPEFRGSITFREFKAGLQHINPATRDMPHAQLKAVFDRLDAEADDVANQQVDYAGFCKSILRDLLGPLSNLDHDVKRKPILWPALIPQDVLPQLRTDHEAMIANAVRRFVEIAESSTKHDVIVMVDAEQTYLQPAIDHLTLLLQRKYNRDKPRVFGTYQTYLRYAKDRLLSDIEVANRERWYFGAKVVRGAYMVLEREIAQRQGYHSPICASKAATDESFNSSVLAMLDIFAPLPQDARSRKSRPAADKWAVVIASHNNDSIAFVVNEMSKRNIAKDAGHIFFAQLLGMCDSTSMALGREGYLVYKYVPYGPVRTVLPYLIRRAQENSGGVPAVKQELRSLQKELLRRLIPFGRRRVKEAN